MSRKTLRLRRHVSLVWQDKETDVVKEEKEETPLLLLLLVVATKEEELR